MKTCSKCGIEKEDVLFPKARKKCKDCMKEYKKCYYNNNTETIKEKNKQYASNNKEIILKNKKIYYLNNIANIKKYWLDNKENKKRYRLENKKTIKEKNKQYYLDHKENIKQYYLNNKNSIKKYANQYIKIKYKNNPSFKLRNRVSAEIKRALQKLGFSKNGHSIIEYLPYSIQELKEHLEKKFESWMTWENHGNYSKKNWDDNDLRTWTWQIDHIIPQSTLPYASMEEENFQICWALDNLRPLSAKQNVIDGNRR